MDFDQLFRNFSNHKVGVVGDVMLDTYWWGHVERISPEAPVPVVSLDKRETRIGGASGSISIGFGDDSRYVSPSCDPPGTDTAPARPRLSR